MCLDFIRGFGNMLTVFSRLPKSSTWHSYVCVQWRKYLILGAFLLSSVFAGGGKYSKESNQLKKETTLGSNTEPEVKRPDGPFRVAKLNAVWDKAQRRLQPDDLRELLDELQVQDKEEIILKRLHHDGGDKDGSVAADLRDRLHVLMEKYGLWTPLGDEERFSGKSHKKKEAKPKTAEKPKRFTFKDKKLNKLWEKAQRAGFSEGELLDLKTEFVHHQQKLDEYDEVYDRKTAEPASEYNVDQWNDLTSELSADELEDDISAPDSLWQDEPVQIDTKIKDITKHYSALKDRVHKNSHDLDSVDFKEGRVEELWNLALEAGFERDDLTSLRVSSARRKLELLKEELRHFEQKLKKLKHVNDAIQMQKGKIPAESFGKGGDKSVERLDLEIKAKQYALKVDNLQKEIEQRITRRHNEL